MASHYGEAMAAVKKAEEGAKEDPAAWAAIASAHATIGLLDELTKLRLLTQDHGSTH
ncbi:hypothetical protein TPB0596_28400 [Tsukamurella pulmonis]|uniref:Uncharacterized protein n=1 Tax=Tsukamurella pulmonis TaxID=47312 RepID=A0A1H1E3Z0_9ACTN|nr:hypothetical protein [Tsukamurella pulmonis]BDD83077.1 hypothetical protein TPB0596_28400 [Tsukamurella pulmonis]SDQ83320.1 hypothetical protein SAMN04489765_2018 [Tsukamurella pulmonis]SUP21351.1 Uncharacterised protein [Tsukamurella pulmonis]